MRARFLLPLVCSVVSSIGGCSPSGSPNIISPLADQSRPDGCGCFFQVAGAASSSPSLYVFWDDYSGHAWVNLLGTDELVIGEAVLRRDPPFALAETVQWIYRSASSTVVLDLVVTRAPSPQPESCEDEFIGLKGRVSAHHSDRSQSLPVEGGCGC